MATFSLKAMLGLDGKGFKAGIKGSEKDLESFKGKMASVRKALAGAFSVAIVAKFAKSVIDLGSKISDIAGQTGMSVESWQVFSRVASDAGIKVEQIQNAMLKLRQSQDSAIASGGIMEKSFASLGLSIEQVASMRVDELFEAISDAIVLSNHGAEEMRAITTIIGEDNAPKMLEIFNRIGTEGIAKINEGLAETSSLMTNLEAQKLDLFADRMEQWGDTSKKVGSQIGFAFADVVEWLDKVKQRYGDVIGSASLLLYKTRRQDFMSDISGPSAWEEMKAEQQAEIDAATEKAEKLKQLEIQANKDALQKRIEMEDEKERAITAKIMEGHRKRAEEGTKKAEEQAQKERAIREKENARALEKMQSDEMRSRQKTQRDKISGLSEGLRTAESRGGYDSLRNIGANILGSGQNPWADTAATLRQSIKIEEKQLVALEKIADQKNGGGTF